MNKLKQHYGKWLAVVTTPFLFAPMAHAALSTDAQAAVDAVSTTASDFVTEAWAIAIVCVVGFTGIKLFKKAISKAT
ncbi:major coat protein [Vibrio marisflavi]|uniref:Phage coat protein n=1 Tax=Vibrio marisflavi CECT 7928 TaxID=634439 RepID=A0ABM9A4H8_9VIBR|nr:major coat protein [Vibrio marisflavi]CAH0536856.1 hypothetical protein VMF7928_00747 [Vibrio marisflavi CECT 7928]CAH0539798.1 hypothetical protein VMF7928_02455 [Vibrio marisflavi CECT 7928]